MLAAILAAAGLAGCGMGSMMPSGGWFGGSATSTNSTQGITNESLLAAAKVTDEGTADLIGAAQTCPQLVVWPEDQFLTVYEQGREGDGLAVMHRGEITKTARECQVEPGRVAVKYGFSGRVLLGPRGAPGQVTMPVYVIVSDANRQKLRSEPLQVMVQITPDQPIGYFSAVQTVSFEIPEGSRPADYKLFVGFQKPAMLDTGTKKKKTTG